MRRQAWTIGAMLASVMAVPASSEGGRERTVPMDIWVESYLDVTEVAFEIRGAEYTWTCRSDVVRGGIDYDTGCDSVPVHPTGVFSLAATFTATDGREHTLRVLYEVDGSEELLAVHLMLFPLHIRGDEVNRFSGGLELERKVREAPAGVHLEPEWTPSATGDVRYAVVNDSELTLYGTSMRQNFFGHIESEDPGGDLIMRGFMCGTVAMGVSLPPESRTTSIEGYYIGKPTPLDPGDYIYTVSVSDAAPLDWHVLGTRVANTFDVSMAFTIDGPH